MPSSAMRFRSWVSRSLPSKVSVRAEGYDSRVVGAGDVGEGIFASAWASS